MIVSGMAGHAPLNNSHDVRSWCLITYIDVFVLEKKYYCRKGFHIMVKQAIIGYVTLSVFYCMAHLPINHKPCSKILIPRASLLERWSSLIYHTCLLPGPRQNGRQIGRRPIQIYILEWKCLTLDWKCVPKSPIKNIAALVQIITMTSSNGNIFRVTGFLCGEFAGPGEIPTHRPMTRSFDVFFDLRLNKRLSKQPWGWWFATPSWPLWRQCNDALALIRWQAIVWTNGGLVCWRIYASLASVSSDIINISMMTNFSACLLGIDLSKCSNQLIYHLCYVAGLTLKRPCYCATR